MPASWFPTRSSTASFPSASISRIARKGFILDGFPRTLVQADALEAMLARMRSAVIESRSTTRGRDRVSDDIPALIAARLSTKRQAEDEASATARSTLECRADDNPRQRSKTRLQAYYKETAPLIGYYYAKGKLQSVDGMADVDAGDGGRSNGARGDATSKPAPQRQ